MASYEMTPPLSNEEVARLRAGDQVFLSGVLVTARDAAHQRLDQLLREGRELPIDLKGHVLYYVGPCPPKPGDVIGSAGPTTAYRMDPYTPRLFEYGVKGAIGKGPRGPQVKEACRAYGAVSFSAVGGASALLGQRVKKVELVAYEDLGIEAIRAFTVDRLPVLVAYDSLGQDVYETEKQKYRRLS
ncbi:fumarate hydratase subunit beta [Melghirimyces thermohalophilus]|uniref:Fumarate hydratase subunit beta n=1 Tax=Melghirimyces thermohalophilus TaxID=1236220 RepID=A0A1G6IUU5_9BACL|nr:FumA C-terminus/TtdB family hydratase beta subunit [Melghirimyces thermohalophilus]SDC10269.1 fumarate hydratase subunit beta [Melghirimyces thermohalophilus]